MQRESATTGHVREPGAARRCNQAESACFPASFALRHAGIVSLRASILLPFGRSGLSGRRAIEAWFL